MVNESHFNDATLLECCNARRSVRLQPKQEALPINPARGADILQLSFSIKFLTPRVENKRQPHSLTSGLIYVNRVEFSNLQYRIHPWRPPGSSPQQQHQLYLLTIKHALRNTHLRGRLWRWRSWSSLPSPTRSPPKKALRPNIPHRPPPHPRPPQQQANPHRTLQRPGPNNRRANARRIA